MVRQLLTDDEPAELGAPVWLRILGRYGVAGAIALGLTYLLAGDLRADVKQMLMDHQELRFYMRAICLNAADDPIKAARCIPNGESR